MKKKIIIVFTGSMELGGIERSLLGLLDALDYSKYDVDLFLYGHHGPLFSFINPNVNILPEVRELAYLRESLKNKITNKSYYSVLLRLVDQFLSKIRPINNDLTWAKVVKKCAPSLKEEYDLAIGFFRPFDYIFEKVNAKLRVGWIHTDYSAFSKDELSYIKKEYQKLDQAVAVSEACRDAFVSVFPELNEKTTVIENILSPDYIRREAMAFDAASEMQNQDSIIFLSIGRFSYAKNFENIPDICRRIREKGHDIIWYLIGYGNQEALIRQKIKDAGMENYVKILGKKNNPYPYIAYCDVYVQPSRFEGKCVAVREAQILGTPVIITNYATSASQVQDGYDGMIVPMDNKKCAEAIAYKLNDHILMKNIKNNLEDIDFSNTNEIKKIMGFLSE